MEPIQTPRTEITYVDEAEVEMPARHDEYGRVLSTWELDDEEREALAQGGRIEVGINQDPPPQVTVKVSGPWCKNCGQEQVWSPQLESWTCPVTEIDD